MLPNNGSIGGYGQPGQNPVTMHTPSAPPMSAASEKPKKFITIDGVMQKNPAYEQYLQSQGKAPQQSQHHQPAALPIISNMDEHADFNAASQQTGAGARRLAPSMNATIDMMQEPEMAGAIGLDSDEMVDGLGNIFAKYEVPMGLMNKLMMLGEFDSLQFIVDNSGSMGANSDTRLPNGQPQTRWQEAESRLIKMMEVLAYVPCAPIEIRFLNGNDKVHIQHSAGQTPAMFLQDAKNKINQAFRKRPSSTTPALEKLAQSINEGRGKSVARYFFGDGVPNGGDYAIKQIETLIKNRPSPQQNPVTFLSCTDEDSQVEWMKDLEEVAPYCAEYDDYHDERDEVLRDQGQAFPFSEGFHLIGQLVAAMNPDDLDAMDESVPFTKGTLDNLLGIVHSPQEYQHYFQHFVQAQHTRQVESNLDTIKKNMPWDQHFNDFLNVPVAKNIPAVQQFKQQLLQASGGQGQTPTTGANSYTTFTGGGSGGAGPYSSSGYQPMSAQPPANQSNWGNVNQSHGLPPYTPRADQNPNSMSGRASRFANNFFNGHKR